MKTQLVLPFSLVDDTETGDVYAVTAAAASQTLDPGIYKIAAMGSPLLWKLGPTDVTTATGSYLAAGDQELIKVPGVPGTDTVDISYILSSDASGDGEINIVLVNLYEITTTKPEVSTILA